MTEIEKQNTIQRRRSMVPNKTDFGDLNSLANLHPNLKRQLSMNIKDLVEKQRMS